MDKYQKIPDKFKNKEEKITFFKTLKKANLSEIKNIVTFTDFLNPLEVSIFITRIEKIKINANFTLFGGFKDSERVILGFYPKNSYLDYEQFPICILLIKYNNKYVKNLTHRDFLGAIISLGLKRNKIGDILVKENECFCFIHKDVSEYLLSNLTKVGGVKVTASLIENKDFELEINSLNKKLITVSSMRLDSILSSTFNISRNKATSLIKSEKVFLNWSLQTSSSKIVSEQDNITLRGFGRLKVIEKCGKTKKNKFLLKILTTIK